MKEGDIVLVCAEATGLGKPMEAVIDKIEALLGQNLVTVSYTQPDANSGWGGCFVDAHIIPYGQKKERELTALQWAEKGYVLNPNAVGEERWTNCAHVKKAVYYSECEVHEDKEAAEDILKAGRIGYRKTAKDNEARYKKAMAIRENMKTEWQWLQEGRIPNPDAHWEYGKNLNEKYNICAYGSKHYYCHINDTHVPENNRELQQAIKKLNQSYME